MVKETNLISKKMKMIHHLFAERRNRHMVQFNLTSSQMDILAYLKFHEGVQIYQREIEEAFRLKNPTVTGILNRLEEKNFIVRKTNGKDRRFRYIELTEKSSRMMSDICEEAWQMDERIYSCMTEEERQKLIELLDRILDSLSKS